MLELGAASLGTGSWSPGTGKGFLGAAPRREGVNCSGFPAGDIRSAQLQSASAPRVVNE